ncbi:MAG: c-type cytochrome [Candidatus Lambdaproteobacteria bacterium]|nr:c-type cytochrome [Candidatus Lambdaproteobacteria bacterium]
MRSRRSILLRGVLLGAIGLGLIARHDLRAQEGEAIVKRQCVTCHNISGPAPQDVAGVLRRKAPDLFYAGSKFQRAWLVKWLQQPTPIRQAGPMFLNHLVTRNGKDKINESSVKPCPSRLYPRQATAVSDFLMTLRNPAMKAGIIAPSKPFSDAKAFRLFSKQLPCNGCHTVNFKNRKLGGVSGPDLRSAGLRLNPDWVYARIQNPQYWDPRTWMPRIEMSREKRELLALFVSSQR